MINSERIGQIISNPMLLEGSDAEGLSKLIEKYPYSSTIYVLNSLVQQKIKSVDFDELLKKSAAHSVDRARLYELLHGEKEGKTEKETERAEVLREKIIETESAEVALPETVLPEEIEKDVAVEASLVKESGAGSEKKSDDIAPEVALKSAEDKADQEKQSLKNSDEELNKIIISNIVGKAYELAPEEMLPSSGNEISENEKSEDLGTIAKGFAPKAKRQPEPEIEEETDEIEPVDTSKMSFTEWLAYKKLMSDPDVKSSEKRAKKTESLEGKRKTQASFFNPAKNAKESLIERDDLVTETLAKIHVMQHNFGKAIESYQQLMLLHPEKKAYFADRIKEIESRIGR